VTVAVVLPDLNVLINAHRTDSPAHVGARDWLRSAFAGEEALGLCAPVLMGLVRVLTHPRVFDPPDTLEQAFDFVDALTEHPNAVVLKPGRDHLRLFRDMCVSVEAGGDLVADAYLAALAAETGATLVSADRHFARFPGVDWLRP